MPQHALGLIETLGLIAAIEATDAATKAAAVVVSSVELTDAAYLTLRIEGELGAVQAAVEAGVMAAEKVGGVVSVTVIPNPDDGLEAILPLQRFVSKYHPDDFRPPLDLEGSPRDNPSGGMPRSNRGRRNSGGTAVAEFRPEEPVTVAALRKMTVPQLRKYARTLEGLSLKGREISTANKQQLIEAIKNLLKLE